MYVFKLDASDKLKNSFKAVHTILDVPINSMNYIKSVTDEQIKNKLVKNEMILMCC